MRRHYRDVEGVEERVEERSCIGLTEYKQPPQIPLVSRLLPRCLPCPHPSHPSPHDQLQPYTSDSLPLLHPSLTNALLLFHDAFLALLSVISSLLHHTADTNHKMSDILPPSSVQIFPLLLSLPTRALPFSLTPSLPY